MIRSGLAEQSSQQLAACPMFAIFSKLRKRCLTAFWKKSAGLAARRRRNIDNSPPTEPQAEEVRLRIRDIKSLKSKADVERVQITGEIEALTRRLDAASLESATLQEQITSLEGIISPLRCFPAELLSNIFKVCLASALASSLYRSDDVLQPPNIFGRICSRWRAVALGTPQLWRAIELPNLRKPLHGGHIAAMAERSRPCLLRLNISILCPEPLGTPLASIWSLCSRLQSSTVKASPEYFQPLVGMTSDMFPSLETLVLTVVRYIPGKIWYGRTPHEQIVGTIDAFRTAPLLTSVDLFGWKQLSNEESFPWSQLTGIRLQADGVERLRQIIRLCGQLETLDLCWSTEAPYDPEATKARRSEIVRSAIVLGGLSLPGLRRISLQGGYEEIQGLNELYDRGPFELDALELGERSPYEAQELISLFHRTTSVRKLCLHDGIRADRDLWNVLTYSKEHDTLLPNLEELTVSDVQIKHTDNFAAMLESSWWPEHSEESKDSNGYRPMSRLRRVTVRGELVDGLRGKLDGAFGECVHPYEPSNSDSDF
ncbi:hypothetical protein FB45DRAFT_1006299 [Roridomyces roridus]|uniref:F-box domain-containing protein n=1 Tax=Roridomyces roridus TaxID=1738132 RepID=A0AAD7FII4_9AGAR|nr:hypothetical protein FB45DRAFT_1006299 [Roridomyces roridus]